jgi:glycosyltransferase involved in cell wall biosynthesis
MGLQVLLRALIDHAPADIGIRCCPARGGLAPLRIGALLKELGRNSVDVIHVLTSHPVAVAASLAARRLRIPIVGSFDTTPSRGTTVHRAYRRALCRSCDRVFAPSTRARSRLIEQGIAETRILLWRPGVDSAMFSVSKRSAGLRDHWQVSDVRPAVIYVGPLSDADRAAQLMSIESALRRSHPIHRLVVVGDGPLRRTLESRCGQAIFLGAVPHEAMPELLASADIFIAPHDDDAWAFSVLEAQACGLPCVVMADSSARERVLPASAVACESVVDMTIATAALARDAARRAAMARAAREHAAGQQWKLGLSTLFAGYRSVAVSSDRRRDLRPALISQSRRL